MAKEPNQESAPALIDYAGAAAASESASKGNAFADCKSHWKKELFRVHKIGGVLWGIKEQTNLSRLLKQFEPEEVKRMMTLFIEKTKVTHSSNFGIFYATRYDNFKESQPKEYDW